MCMKEEAQRIIEQKSRAQGLSQRKYSPPSAVLSLKLHSKALPSLSTMCGISIDQTLFEGKRSGRVCVGVVLLHAHARAHHLLRINQHQHQHQRDKKRESSLNHTHTPERFPPHTHTLTLTHAPERGSERVSK
jgi:hypothetical protein